MTPARIAANRVRAWKHGGRARLVSRREVLGARLDRVLPGAASICDAYLASPDDPEALSAIHVEAMVESELLRRAMVQEIRKRGVLIEETLIDKDGRAIGTRVKANPALGPMRHLDEQLGHTAEQMQLTRKSRGEGAVNAELATKFRFERDAALRALDCPRRSLPPPSKSFGR